MLRGERRYPAKGSRAFANIARTPSAKSYLVRGGERKIYASFWKNASRDAKSSDLL